MWYMGLAYHFFFKQSWLQKHLKVFFGFVLKKCYRCDVKVRKCFLWDLHLKIVYSQLWEKCVFGLKNIEVFSLVGTKQDQNLLVFILFYLFLMFYQGVTDKNSETIAIGHLFSECGWKI